MYATGETRHRRTVMPWARSHHTSKALVFAVVVAVLIFAMIH
jgi:hypothetical protein